MQIAILCWSSKSCCHEGQEISTGFELGVLQLVECECKNTFKALSEHRHPSPLSPTLR